MTIETTIHLAGVITLVGAVLYAIADVLLLAYNVGPLQEIPSTAIDFEMSDNYQTQTKVTVQYGQGGGGWPALAGYVGDSGSVSATSHATNRQILWDAFGQLGAAEAGREQALADFTPPLEEALTASHQPLVVDPEHLFEDRRRHPAEEACHHHLADRLPICI